MADIGCGVLGIVHLLCERVRDQIIAAGRLSAAELGQLSTELREHLQQPGTVTSQPNMWQAWGIKP